MPKNIIAAYYAAYHAINADQAHRWHLPDEPDYTAAAALSLTVWELYQQKYGENPGSLEYARLLCAKRQISMGCGDSAWLSRCTAGELWDVADHNNLQLMKGQIRRMRQWMIDHGQQPLWITRIWHSDATLLGFRPQWLCHRRQL